MPDQPLRLSDLKPEDVKPAGPLRLSELPQGAARVVVEDRPVPPDSFGEDLAGRALNGIRAFGETWDAYTGAPSRAALDAAVKGENPLQSFWQSFGGDPARVARGREIAEKAGISDTTQIPVPGTRDPKTGASYRVTPAQAVGAGIDVLADWSNFVPISTAAKVVKYGATQTARVAGKAAAGVAKVALGGETAGKIGRGLGTTVTGVPGKDIKAYSEMTREEVANLPSSEQLKNIVDRGVAELEGQLTAAKTAVETEREGLKQAYKEKLAELKQMAVPLNQAQAMGVVLEDSKRALGALSEQADDALARSNTVFRKKDVLRFIDKIGGEVGIGPNKALVGEKAQAAVQKLFAMRQRIAEGLPDGIPAADMRDLLRQVRDDIDYGGAAGEFNDTLNKMRKEFARGISDVLKTPGKGGSSEYAAYMARMSDLADNHEQLVKYFGTPERALSSLDALAKDGKGARVVRDVLDRYAELTGNKAPLDALASYKTANETLRRASVNDLSGELFPDQAKRLKDLEGKLAVLNVKIDPVVRRLSPASTQGILKGQGAKTPSIEDRRALEALNELLGIDVLGDLRRRNAANAFDTDHTRGSRMAFVGGATGGALTGGDPTAIGLGAWAGAQLDKTGPMILRDILDAQKGPLIRPPDMTPGQMLETWKTDFLKRGRSGTLPKAAQTIHVLSDEAEKKREAMRRRQKRGD